MEKELRELFNEVRLTFNTIAELADRMHTEEGVTVGMRAVMEYLSRNGPHTVPEIARARHLTRQRIQALANELLDAGLVELIDNPAHKRSSKLALTTNGEKTMQRMTRAEAKLLESRDWPVAGRDLSKAASVLQAVRRGLEGIDR